VNLKNERKRENRARQEGIREERMKKISWVNAIDVKAVRLNDIGLILTVGLNDNRDMHCTTVCVSVSDVLCVFVSQFQYLLDPPPEPFSSKEYPC